MPLPTSPRATPPAPPPTSRSGPRRAPLSNTLDALTFLSLGRAWVLIGTWVVVLAAWGALRHGSPSRRVLRAGLGAAAVFLLAAATVVVPRPVPRLESADSAATVIDYHAHTAAS